jgi:hypothetical protein
VAKLYTTTGSFQTVRVLSQTSVLDVEAIGIVTHPSAVRLTVPVPLAAFNAGNWQSYLEVTAGLIESLIASTPDPGQSLVSGGSGSQQIDAAGLLAYYVNFTVAYTPTTGQQGTFSTIVTLPVSSFESAAAFNTPVNGELPLIHIEKAYARMKALAAA